MHFYFYFIIIEVYGIKMRFFYEFL